MALRYGQAIQRQQVDAVQRDAAKDRLSAEIASVLKLSAEDEVMIREIWCQDPACPGLETVVVVCRPGNPANMFKIPAAIVDVRLDDLPALLNAPQNS